MVEKRTSVEEAEESKVLRYATFFSRNKWRIVGAVCLAVAVVMVIGLVQYSHKRNEAKAFEAHLKAETPKDYQRVAEEFPGTFQGGMSLIDAGTLLFEEGKFAEARKLYLRFLEENRESPMRAWANNLVGATFEAEKKYDRAIEYYRKAEASDWLKFQAKFNIGRCHELKGDAEEDPQVALEVHYAKAHTYYRQLTETTGSSPGAGPRLVPWREQAEARVSVLAEKERKARERVSEKRS